MCQCVSYFDSIYTSALSNDNNNNKCLRNYLCTVDDSVVLNTYLTLKNENISYFSEYMMCNEKPKTIEVCITCQTL